MIIEKTAFATAVRILRSQETTVGVKSIGLLRLLGELESEGKILG